VADVFVSYAREDGEFVRWLSQSLTEQGREVWVDLEDIPPSADWLEEIRRGIEGSGAVVFVVSPDSLASQVCVREMERADELNKRIVPVVCREPGEVPAPELIASRNWIFCRAEEEREPALEKLTTALDTDLEWTRVHTRLLVRSIE